MRLKSIIITLIACLCTTHDSSTNSYQPNNASLHHPEAFGQNDINKRLESVKALTKNDFTLSRRFCFYTSIANSKTCKNQKDSFCSQKGLVLLSKRTRFALQKDSFCNPKGLHFQRNRISGKNKPQNDGVPTS